MPYDLSALQSNTGTCTVDYGEAGDVNVVYRLANVTEKVLERLRILADDDILDMTENLVALRGVIVRLVVRWDLTDHGQPVPVTPEGVADTPAEVLADILRAMIKDARVGESNGARSAPTSRGSTARRAARSSRRRA